MWLDSLFNAQGPGGEMITLLLHLGELPESEQGDGEPSSSVVSASVFRPNPDVFFESSVLVL